MLKGCDISKWQGAQFDVSNEEFVIIKATEGRTYVDPMLKTHLAKCLEQNKIYGFYHFARPDNGNTPEEEVDNFLTTIGEHIGKCFFALDYEAKAHNTGQDWALEWLRLVEEKTGVKPFFYTSQSFLKKYNKVAEAGYPLWVARYSTSVGNIAPFTKWKIWQKTSSPYDQDYFSGTTAELKSFCGISEAKEKCECSVCRALREAGVIE